MEAQTKTVQNAVVGVTYTKISVSQSALADSMVSRTTAHVKPAIVIALLVQVTQPLPAPPVIVDASL